MHLIVLTPERKVFEGEVDSISLPGSEQMGSFQLLDNHAPIISSLKSGRMTIKHDGEITNYIIQKGFVEASDNNVSVLVEDVNSNYTPEDLK